MTSSSPTTRPKSRVLLCTRIQGQGMGVKNDSGQRGKLLPYCSGFSGLHTHSSLQVRPSSEDWKPPLFPRDLLKTRHQQSWHGIAAST